MKTINDITPEAYMCALTAACPAVYATDRGTLLVIGRELHPAELPVEIRDKMAGDEIGIEIPRGLVAGIGEQEGDG